jgi:hypothetical protein
MRKVVPEKHSQIPDGNLGIRRLTSEMVAYDAFGKYNKTKPNQAVSSFLVEQFRIFDPGTLPYNRSDVLRIFSCGQRAAFDPYVKEVGKK